MIEKKAVFYWRLRPAKLKSLALYNLNSAWHRQRKFIYK